MSLLIHHATPFLFLQNSTRRNNAMVYHLRITHSHCHLMALHCYGGEIEIPETKEQEDLSAHCAP